MLSAFVEAEGRFSFGAKCAALPRRKSRRYDERLKLTEVALSRKSTLALGPSTIACPFA